METSETSQQIQEGVFFLKLIGSLQVDRRQRPLVETKNPRGSLQLDGREGDKGHFLRPIRELLPEKICHRRRLAGRDAAGGHHALRAGVPSQADGRRVGRGRWVDGGGRGRRGGMDTWSRCVLPPWQKQTDGQKKDTLNLQKSKTLKEGGCKKIGGRSVHQTPEFRGAASSLGEIFFGGIFVRLPLGELQEVMDLSQLLDLSHHVDGK